MSNGGVERWRNLKIVVGRWKVESDTLLSFVLGRWNIQVEVFSQAVGLDGIILTKLDGTAKGGMVLAIKEEVEEVIEVRNISE